MNLNNLSNYEKGALAAFGTKDAAQTVNHLAEVAILAKHDEDERRMTKLIDKVLEMNFNNDYSRYFYSNAEEIDKIKIQSALDYQNLTGDLETGKPWKNYLLAVMADTFCSDDPDLTRYRLNHIWDVSVDPDFKECVLELKTTIAGISSTDEDNARYQKFRIINENIIRAGRNKRRQGKDLYRQYVWSVPRIGVFDV